MIILFFSQCFFIPNTIFLASWPRLIWSAGLFVVVSWISFVVPPDVIPGRMALLITLFLVLVNIFNTVNNNIKGLLLFPDCIHHFFYRKCYSWENGSPCLFHVFIHWYLQCNQHPSYHATTLHQFNISSLKSSFPCFNMVQMHPTMISISQLGGN